MCFNLKPVTLDRTRTMGAMPFFLIVFAQHFDDFGVFFVEFVDTFFFFYILNPLLIPVFVIIDETVFVYIEAFSTKFLLSAFKLLL